MSREPTYSAIPTTYRGVQFRSRLEARVANFLDQCGLLWDFEPIDLKNYVPDFLVELPHGVTLLECKPAVLPNEFRGPCRKITRSGWVGPAIVIGSQLCLAPDDRADLTMWGSPNADEGGWSRVGRERWPAEWGEYPFDMVHLRWVRAGNQVQWCPP